MAGRCLGMRGSGRGASTRGASIRAPGSSSRGAGAAPPAPIRAPVMPSSSSNQEEQAPIEEQAPLQASGDSSRRIRSTNWSMDETVALVELKKEDVFNSITATGREACLTQTQRWHRIARKMFELGYEHRADEKVCRRKWNNLLNDYKAIHDYSRRSGAGNYFVMSPTDRRSANLPVAMGEELFEALDSIVGTRPATTPAAVADSDAPPANEAVDPTEGDEAMGEAPGAGGSSGKKKKRARVSDQSMTSLLSEGNSLLAARNDHTICIQRELLDLEKKKVASHADFVGAIVNLSRSVCSFLSAKENLAANPQTEAPSATPPPAANAPTDAPVVEEPAAEAPNTASAAEEEIQPEA